MQRVLVTGGAGYVGSRLVPVLLNKGYIVRVLDWFLYSPNVFNYLRSNPRLEIIRGDIRDISCVDKSLEMVDTVIHLAAISNDPSSELYPDLTRQVNVDAVCYLVKAAQRSGVRRFINASSASVYGITEKVATEEHPLNPRSLYARCKAESEIAISSANSKELTTVNVRPATLCGYSPRLRLDLIVNTLTYHAICRGKVTVFGGEQKRPILCLQDMINAYLCILKADVNEISGQTFNIHCENYRALDIAFIVQKSFEKQIEIEILPTLDRRSYRLSSEKICSRLGFKPSYTITNSIEELKQAFCAGYVPAPDHPKYYNVRFLHQHSFI